MKWSAMFYVYNIIMSLMSIVVVIDCKSNNEDLLAGSFKEPLDTVFLWPPQQKIPTVGFSVE